METREVDPDRWVEFIQDFSRQHEGWLVRIEVLDEVVGPHKLAEGQPLQGMSLDTRGTQPSSLSISVGDQPDSYIRHVVSLPLHIRIAEARPGEAVDLQIEPATGPQTLLHLQSPGH